MKLDTLKLWVRKDNKDEWNDQKELGNDILLGSFSISETLSGNYEGGKFEWIANSNDEGIIEEYSKPFEPYMQMKLEIDNYNDKQLKFYNNDTFKFYNGIYYFAPFKNAIFDYEGIYQIGYMGDYDLLIPEGKHKISEYIETNNVKFIIYANKKGNTTQEDYIDTVYGDFEFEVYKSQRGFKYKEIEYASFSIQVSSKNISYWLLENDRTYRKAIGIWGHQIEFVEGTKLLENIMCPNLTFTKPTGYEVMPREMNYNTLYDMVVRIREVCKVSPYESDERVFPYLFDISSELETELKKYEGFDTTYMNNNLYEIIVDIFSVFNSIPRLEYDEISGEFRILTFRKRNEKKELVNLREENIGYEASNNASNYITEYETNIENAISNNNIVDSGWITGRPILDENATELTPENYGFELDYPIKKIIKVECKLNIYDKDYTYQYDSLKYTFNAKEKYPKFFKSFDVTNIFLDKERYELLSNKNNLSGQSYLEENIITSRKENMLYYEDKKIYINNNLDNVFLKALTRFVALLDFAGEEVKVYADGQITTLIFHSYLQFFYLMWGGAGGNDYWNRIINTQFRFYYLTDINTTFNVVKDLYQTGLIKREGQIQQSTNVIDLNRFSIYARDTLRSTGNQDKQYIKVVNNYDMCYKLGQYDNEGYVVQYVANRKERDRWYSQCLATKNFQNVGGWYRAKTQYRQYSITKEDSTRRDIKIKDCVVLYTLENYINFKKYKTSIEERKLMFTFSENIYGYEEQNNPLMFHFDNGPHNYVFKIKNENIENVSNFIYEFQHPILAGKSINSDNSIDKWYYTNSIIVNDDTYSNGELEIIEKLAIGRYKNEENYLTSNAYPLIDNNNSFIENIEINNLKILKDPLERLRINYQIHFLSNDKDIIIGPAFAKYNWFVTGKKANCKLFISDELYSINDKKVKSVIGEPNEYEISETSINIGETRNFMSWGVYNVDTNELFFVVNSKNKQTIYLKSNFYDIMS